VKIAWTIETEPAGEALTRLRTETRVEPTDESARRKFRRYWRRFGVGIVAIRWLGLPAIRREAERRHRLAPFGEPRVPVGTSSRSRGPKSTLH
jgi:hypothetical protein